MRVLIVDDCEITRIVVGDMVKSISPGKNEVIESSNGCEAIGTLMKERDISIVISDMDMPGLSGTEFLEKAAKEKLLEGKKVILMSADEIDVEQIHGIGVVDSFLKKPFTQKRLHTEIERLTA